jgi:hypothetical protein
VSTNQAACWNMRMLQLRHASCHKSRWRALLNTVLRTAAISPPSQQHLYVLYVLSSAVRPSCRTSPQMLSSPSFTYAGRAVFPLCCAAVLDFSQLSDDDRDATSKKQREAVGKRLKEVRCSSYAALLQANGIAACGFSPRHSKKANKRHCVHAVRWRLYVVTDCHGENCYMRLLPYSGMLAL